MNRLFALPARIPMLGALALAAAGCVSPRQPPRPVVLHQQEAGLTLTEADANREIAMQAGQTVTIRLEENGASTGYRWEERSGSGLGGVLSRVGNPTISRGETAPGMTGVPGTLTQTYFARQPGRHQIRWARIPPGAGREPEADTVTFEVIVH
ncbi:MAG: protease inhibitor I42 family protein [Verrucomicrobia bacterium]|nr:protease inhibitor I42 family protein [Verrucomicrobiota bacterium]